MKKKKGLKIALIIVVIVLILAAAGGVAAYIYYSNYINITVNGIDAEKKSTEKLLEELADQFNKTEVTIREGESDELTGSLQDFGYTANVDKMETYFKKTYRKKMGNPIAIIKSLANGGTSIDTKVLYDFDEETFQNYVKSTSFKTERVPYADGTLKFSKKKLKYVVTKTVQGNEIDDSLLQTAVKESIEKVIASHKPEAISYETTEDLYLVKDKDTMVSNKTLKAQAKALNQYAGAKINYQFGDETVTLDFSTIKDWLSLQDDNTVVLDESNITQYVSELASTYDTRFKNRTFTTTAGQTITFDAVNNEYGYTIIQEDEAAQLKADILAGQEVTREPIYKTTNDYGNPVYHARNGKDDLAGTYVEVDLSTQHLWFYKDGNLLVDEDIVSGDVAQNHQTATGVYPLAYKESPSVLSSDENGYEVNVNYWMPFYEGQGLHDATWRDAFGGDIFRTDGSHGCVNLSLETAKTIYENIDSGTAIILYQSAGEEAPVEGTDSAATDATATDATATDATAADTTANDTTTDTAQ